jgi:hypothetical protein
MKTTNQIQSTSTSPRSKRRGFINLALLGFLSVFMAPIQSYAEQIPTVNPPLTGFPENIELKAASRGIPTKWVNVKAVPSTIKNGGRTQLVGQLLFRKGSSWVPLPNKRVTVQTGSSKGNIFNAGTDRNGNATFMVYYSDPKFVTSSRPSMRNVSFRWSFNGDATYRPSFMDGIVNVSVNPPPPSMSDIALARGEQFLADNAKKTGVKVTASGLQYEVIGEGTGKSPLATSTVEIRYEGKLINGKVFDSTYKRGQTAVFPLNRIIAGLAEGLLLMKEGSMFRFFIPSRLAYGLSGVGPDIGPNEVLIFDVELLNPDWFMQ